MAGFAGVVNYRQNFLFEIVKWTDTLTQMLGCGGQTGQCDSISIVEDCAAFLLNSNREIKKDDYYKRVSDNVYYLAGDGGADRQVLLNALINGGAEAVKHLSLPFSGAFYSAADKKLLLFRRCERSIPLFYAQNGEELVFGSKKASFDGLGASCAAVELSPGSCVEFTEQGLEISKI